VLQAQSKARLWTGGFCALAEALEVANLHQEQWSELWQAQKTGVNQTISLRGYKAQANQEQRLIRTEVANCLGVHVHRNRLCFRPGLAAKDCETKCTTFRPHIASIHHLTDGRENGRLSNSAKGASKAFQAFRFQTLSLVKPNEAALLTMGSII
jgi:hypothetical protein